MPRSARVSDQNFRQLLRLIGECREIGADAFIWRQHLLVGMRPLLGDFLGIVGAGRFALPARVARPSLIVEHGWDCDSSRRHWLEYMAQMGPQADPYMNRFLEIFDPPLQTRVRRQLVSDADHFRSDYYQDYLRPLHLGDSLCSFLETSDGRFEAVVLHRRINDPPWTARELQVLDLLHREIAPMIGRELADFDGHDAVPLPPRMHQTLDAMLEGLSEKETAARLDLSGHTVHQYVKALYRRYRVRSRSELLALWIRRHRLSLP